MQRLKLMVMLCDSVAVSKGTSGSRVGYLQMVCIHVAVFKFIQYQVAAPLFRVSRHTWDMAIPSWHLLCFEPCELYAIFIRIILVEFDLLHHSQ